MITPIFVSLLIVWAAFALSSYLIYRINLSARAPKITYQEFKESFDRNPTHWKLYYNKINYIIKKPKPISAQNMTIDFKTWHDYIQYCIFYKKYTRQGEKRTRNKYRAELTALWEQEKNQK